MISESISRLGDSRASLLDRGESKRVVQTHGTQRVNLTSEKPGAIVCLSMMQMAS